LRVPQECDGLGILDTFCQLVAHLPVTYWEAECRNGNLLDSRHQVLDEGYVVRAGERLLHRLDETTEPAVNGDVKVLHEDEALIVLSKPAPLPMHAGGRYARNTLQQILNTVYRPQKPKPAHRLDANTTGVVLVARSRHFAGRLQTQFSDGRVGKTYLARVQGHPAADDLRCDAPIGREAGVSGTREVDEAGGDAAVTMFTVLQRLPDGGIVARAPKRPLVGQQARTVGEWDAGASLQFAERVGERDVADAKSGGPVEECRGCGTRAGDWNGLGGGRPAGDRREQPTGRDGERQQRRASYGSWADERCRAHGRLLEGSPVTRTA
jgi:23S rRNA-/tRNA-specific pseudouridylate synthase